MFLKTIHYNLNVSPQEGEINENSRTSWNIDSDINAELGISGLFFSPNNDAFEMNPNTYNIIELEANEPRKVLDVGLILMMVFMENMGENSIFLDLNSGEGGYPIKLEKNDCIYIRGAETSVMNQLYSKSTLGSKLRFLFTSDGTFQRVNSLDGSTIIDSSNREVVAFL